MKRIWDLELFLYVVDTDIRSSVRCVFTVKKGHSSSYETLLNLRNESHKVC